jgi:hypothetical protein
MILARASLGRLVWAAEWFFVAFGSAFGVRTNRPEIWPQLEKHLPLGSSIRMKPARAPTFSLYVDEKRRSDHRLLVDDTEIICSRSLEEVLERFQSETRLTVAATSPRRVFVHAGAVAVNERGVLFPGRSFHGKSTLVAALLKAGATYYSDEFAVLDYRGRLHPYAIPVSLRIPGTPRVKHVCADSLGAPIGRRPVMVRLVLETSYQPGGHWRPERLTSGQMALAILRDTVTARRRPARSLAALRLLSERASAFKSARGDAEEVASWILNYLT